MKTTENRVIIKKDPLKEKIGNIYIPKTEKKQTYTGIVEAVGPKADPSVKVGMHVAYERYTGVEMPEFEGYQIVRDHDIIGECQSLQ